MEMNLFLVVKTTLVVHDLNYLQKYAKYLPWIVLINHLQEARGYVTLYGTSKDFWKQMTIITLVDGS